MTLKIRALHVGTLKDFPTAAITYHRGFARTQDVAMIMFLIEGGEHPVIIDTGTGDPEYTKRHHGYDLVRPSEQEPLAVLEKAGIDPADVGTVIHTHLHWDHCSNDELFPNARIIVQKAELEYAIDPLEPNRVAFERIPGILPPWVPVLDRIATVLGDAPVMPGISLVHLPGHTPGSQGVLVDTGSRRYLVAGDCVDQHDNWTGDEKLRHIPSGSFTNLHDYMNSFDKIEQLACEVIPSHDFAVLKEGTFGG